MRPIQHTQTLLAVMIALSAVSLSAHAAERTVQLGPRPFYLVDRLQAGGLKDKLEACAADIQSYQPHDFSIGHRGAALQFPEHTKESYEAGRRMGAGILECDVTFTKDGELVCRHAQCDSENPDDKLAGLPSVIHEHPPTLEAFVEVRSMGVNIIAPPMPVLVKASADGQQITPSEYAGRARQAGFDLISWTTERSGRIVENVLEGGDTFYYQTTLDALTNDGDILRTIDVLAQDVGIIGLFSDWPATTTFYANCLK